MSLPAENTLLVLYDMGQPLYAARGLIQTVSPIAAAKNTSRSINGVAMDLSYDQFKLYASEITCTDFETPSLDGVWPGQVIGVDCVFELSYVTSTEGPSRPVVTGSERTDGDITFYRPHLEMMVVEFESGFSEYEAEYSWKLSLEETELPAVTA